jgi:WD40 repeat protein
MNEQQAPVAHRDSPYFGLDYYDEKFGPWFFGREAEGGKVITNLRAARLTLLHADSGVGKSSLLRAGVAWRIRKLADDRFAQRKTVRSVPVVFSSWKDDPVLELAGCLSAAIKPYLDGQPAPALPTDQLDLAIETASAAVNANLLIMLDQFEEYFLYRSREKSGNEPAPERFADQLSRCINRSDLRGNFLIAIREDAYAGLGDLFKGRIANVYSNYLHIEYLDRAAAEKAIREPLQVYNSQPGVSGQVEIQDELIEAVLDEVKALSIDRGALENGLAAAHYGSDRIATPLLQLVMEKIWAQERAEGSHELRLSTLRQLRGVRMIADAHLGEALDSLGSAGRQVAIDVFDHLVTPSGGKIAESVSDLAKRTGHNETQVRDVLEKLDDKRIVRSIQAAPGQDYVRFRRYEIFHDVLAPPINRAIATREEQRHNRRTRRLAALAVSLLVIVSAIAVLFAYLLNNANDEKLTAQSHELATAANSNLASDPELSAQLSLQALRLRDTRLAEEALRNAIPNLQTVRRFEAGSSVLSAAFNPANGNEVAGADFAGYTQIWDVKTGKRLATVSQGGFQLTGSADGVAFNPSGTELAVGYGNGTVAIFDSHSGKKLKSASVGSLVNNLAFLGNTGELAIATQHKLVLWQSQQGPKCCNNLSSSPAYTVSVDPQNPKEFAETADNSVIIWNTGSAGKPQQRHLGNYSTQDAEFSPDGSQLVTASENGSLDIYDAATLTKVATLYAGDAGLSTAAFSPDGLQIVAGYSNGTTRVWDVRTRLPLTLLAGSASSVSAAQFNPSGNKVLTASTDGTLRIWDARPREMRAEFTSPPTNGAPNPVYFAGYIGDRVIALDNYGNTNIYDPDGKQASELIVDYGAESAAWNRNGTRIVTESNNGTVEIWQAIGQNYYQADLPSIKANRSNGHVAMTSDGSRFAIVIDDNYTIQVRSADTGKVLRTLSTQHPISAVAFSPSGHEIVAADLSGQVQVWKGTATDSQVLDSHRPDLNDVSFNTSGSKFATASADGVVDVWDARRDRVVTSITACSSPRGAAFSPDGSKVVTSCGDGTVRVFDAATGRSLAVLQASSVGFVTSAAFSPDGKSIVAAVNGGTTGCIQVWNAEIATLPLPALERLAQQRDTEKLSAAQLQDYLTG